MSSTAHCAQTRDADAAGRALHPPPPLLLLLLRLRLLLALRQARAAAAADTPAQGVSGGVAVAAAEDGGLEVAWRGGARASAAPRWQSLRCCAAAAKAAEAAEAEKAAALLGRRARTAELAAARPQGCEESGSAARDCRHLRRAVGLLSSAAAYCAEALRLDGAGAWPGEQPIAPQEVPRAQRLAR